jgi:hypothetical protein
MLIESIVVGMGAILICVGAVMISLRPPQCPTCQIPLQTVEETIRDLGPYGGRQPSTMSALTVIETYVASSF